MPSIALRASTLTTMPSSATATSTSSSVKPRPAGGCARGSLTPDLDLVREARDLYVHHRTLLVLEHEQGGVRGAVRLERERDLARAHRPGGERLDGAEEHLVGQ